MHAEKFDKQLLPIEFVCWNELKRDTTKWGQLTSGLSKLQADSAKLETTINESETILQADLVSFKM